MPVGFCRLVGFIRGRWWYEFTIGGEPYVLVGVGWREGVWIDGYTDFFFRGCVRLDWCISLISIHDDGPATSLLVSS